jgi:homoserine dehydrogenase
MNNSDNMAPFRIGMMGAGTVGGGVYDIIMNRLSANTNNNSTKRPIVITKILVRSLDKERDFHIDTNQTLITTNLDSFFRDSVTNELDIDCVVEVAGGCTVAKEVMIRAIREYDIPVITANKAALFEFNHEFLEALSTLPATKSSCMGIEAAVCGGIPIISLLQTCYVGDRVTSICGICNGTTNYILSKMASNPKEILYEGALQEAQQLGYAEADPTADVEGHDVRAKIALLAQLAYGIYVPMQHIPCTGITKITANDFIIVQDALPTKYTIKLIGRAYVTPSTTETMLGVYVTPMLVPFSSTMASVDGCGNAVQVTSVNLSMCTYMGPGAGRLPTANSVVADIYRTVNKTLPSIPFPKPLSYNDVSLKVVTDYMSSFYIRIEDQATKVNRSNDLTALFLQCNVKIQQLSMPNVGDSNNNTSTFYVIITDTYPLSTIQKVCNETQTLFTTTNASILHLPILPIE